MLCLDGVTKRFGRKTAVAAVDLDLLPGERLCLLGPNGAGKTTLLRVAVGMARPTAGTVLLLGRDPVSEPDARRHLGFLPDEPYLYEKLTAREHLRLHAALYRLPPGEVAQRGVSLLDALKMGDALDGRVETFSFGMQKKLALTLALVHEPDLLVLDEPLNGLDPDSADKMERLLWERSAGDRAVLLSTHSVGFAARFASRVGVMREGRLSLHDTGGTAKSGWLRDLLRGSEDANVKGGKPLDGERI